MLFLFVDILVLLMSAMLFTLGFITLPTIIGIMAIAEILVLFFHAYIKDRRSEEGGYEWDMPYLYLVYSETLIFMIRWAVSIYMLVCIFIDSFDILTTTYIQITTWLYFIHSTTFLTAAAMFFIYRIENRFTLFFFK